MKVMLLSQHFPPEVGAPQIRLYEVGKELQRRGHQVEVVTAFPHHPHGVIPDEYKKKFYQKDTYDGLTVHRSWIYPSPKGSFWRRLASYFSFTFSAFYSVLKAKSTDVIICNSPPLFLGLTGYFSSKIKRAKFVFNVADIWPESAVELGILKNKTFIRLATRLEYWLYRKAWKVAAATEGIEKYVVNKGKKENDVFLLPNGVNIKTFTRKSRNKKWVDKLDFEGKTVFTFAGRMGYAQGLEAVLKSISLVKDRDDIRFLFIGDGPEKDTLIQMKEELQLTNVVFHDSVPVTEMPDIYSITDYSLVSLKNLELFKGARPSKIFPALASGVPILYCGAGESVTLLESNKCGVVAEPENIEDIARKIRDCADLSTEDYENLSLNGREFVVKEYSWEKIVEDLLKELSN
ncbi:glycosyltransferase family 4 protein [Bacillus sp. Cs-700]|uniref:glycosyltransferase family 4 protein n=1 Tax=Bacillus sp. Cs-700 TaxID=2589818 RepID=UPI0014085DF8|nr:glycosyltransferase family 4 protein [Bacillus sp. Cs-700]